jgi:hypothetical protein
MIEHNGRSRPPIPETRLPAPRNMSWAPRPGWATVRLVGSCADRSLRRGQVVVHSPGEEYDILGQESLASGAMVIVLAEAAHLVEDDLHLVPEGAVVAVGEALP